MEIDGDRLNPAASLSPLAVPSSHPLPRPRRPADGDGWRGAPGLGPCRLIIDQEDRDGSRGRGGQREAEPRRRSSGRISRSFGFRSEVGVRGGGGGRGRDEGAASLTVFCDPDISLRGSD